MYQVGIDIGSSAAKAVVMNEGEVVRTLLLNTGFNSRKTAEEIEALIGRIDGVKESFVFGVPANNADEKESKINAEIVYEKERMKEILGTIDEDKIKEYLWENLNLKRKIFFN